MAATGLTAQFSNAIAAANIAGESGLYVIRPRHARQKMLLKMGLTTNVTSRMWTYHTSIPFEAGSFELVAFLRVGESQVRRREAALLRETVGGFGFRKPADDLEWRIFPDGAGARSSLNEALIRLLTHIRTTVDGYFYIFHPETGAIMYKGGRAPTVQVANILPPVPNVLTRAANAQGLRKTQGVLVSGPYGQMVPHAQGTARRLRNHKNPTPLVPGIK